MATSYGSGIKKQIVQPILSAFLYFLYKGRVRILDIIRTLFAIIYVTIKMKFLF